MRRNGVLAAAAAVSIAGWATPAVAQVDPVAVGQGSVLSTTMRAHANRASARGASRPVPSDANFVRICRRDLPRYRRKHGRITDPDIGKLAALCARAGL